MTKSLLAALSTAVLFAACSSGGPDPEAIRRGDAAVSQGKLPEALVEYQRAVQADQRDGVARHKLGITLGKLGDVGRSVEHLSRAADLLPGDARVQLDAAKALLLASRFEDARTRAEGVLKQDPKNVDAHVIRATATAGLKDTATAIETLEEALKLDKNRPGTYIDKATLELSQGKREEAEAGFRQAVAVAPKSVEAHVALANFYWATGRQAETEKSLLNAVAVEPSNIQANQALAGLYRITGRSALAEEPLKRIVASTDDLNAQLALADFYIGEKRVADARARLEAVAKHPAGAPAAKARLAAIEYDAGNRALAYKMLDELLAKNATDAAVMVVKAGWLLSEGKVDESMAIANSAVRADARSADAHAFLGSLHVVKNAPAEAIKDFTSVLQLRPRDLNAMVALVALHLQMGDVEAAAGFAKQAVAEAPGVAGPRHALARVLFAQRRTDEALRELAPVLTAAPTSLEALGLLALIQQRKGDLTAARKTYTRMVELDAKSPDALAGLLALDLAAGKPADAVRRAESAVKAAPDNARIRLAAGRALAAAGETARAEAAFQKALDLDASLVEAYDALGQLFVRQNKLEEARQAYETRTKERPTDVASHTMVARILYVQGKPAESRARFEKILAIDPRAAVASNNLAYMDAEAGTNLDVALNRAQIAKAALPEDPDVNDTLGWVYVKRGLPALAVNPLELAIEKDPSNPLYRYHLGVAHAQAGDKDRARLALQKALELSKSFDGADDARRTLESLGR